MTRTRTAKTADTTPAAAKKTAAKKTTTRKGAQARPARSRTRKATALSLVKPPKPLPTRTRDYMTDVQGYATLAARIVGILTPRITAWTDHGDQTATLTLKDGTLHYNLTTRTLTWQATCLMGAVHTYRLDTPATAAHARVQAATCQDLHADLTTVPPLTANELEALGLLQTPTWARPDLLGDAITETIPVPEEPVAKATASAAETQPMSKDAIAEGLAQRAADAEQAKEHPDHG